MPDFLFNTFYSTKIPDSGAIEFSGIFPTSNTTNIFIFSELPVNISFSHQIFPLILNKKTQTFSFSQAPEKNRRVKGFSPPYSQFL